jgi:hypothetical protein
MSEQELRCQYCGQTLESANQLHDITHCGKYACETRIPALEAQVADMHSRLREVEKEIDVAFDDEARYDLRDMVIDLLKSKFPEVLK